MIEPPCYDRVNKIDCPNRAIDCRETCPRWKLYEEAKIIQYELKMKAYNALDAQYGYMRRGKLRQERLKRKNR